MEDVYPVLLSIDEWILLKPFSTESKDIFELLHRRRKKIINHLMLLAQAKGWYEQLGGDDSPLVDVILDRIVHGLV